MSKQDTFPDSRAREAKELKFINGSFWQPYFCANCGIEGGWCPEENMDFMFWLCNYCFETYGEVAGTLVVPDHEFHQKVREEQLEKYGRYLSPQELRAVVESNTSPLATLIREGR